jgi:diphthamide synthase subunit DPH2
MRQPAEVVAALGEIDLVSGRVVRIDEVRDPQSGCLHLRIQQIRTDREPFSIQIPGACVRELQAAIDEFLRRRRSRGAPQ